MIRAARYCCLFVAAVWSGFASAQTSTPLPAVNASPIEAVLEPPRLPESSETGEAERSERDVWETDRDSFTPSTRIAGRRRLIFETAYSFLENRDKPESHSFPELLFRYGLTRRIELRLGWNREVGGAATSISGGAGDEELFLTGISGENNISYGVKFGLTEQAGWRPESALILMGFTPTAGEETATRPVATYVFGWELPERWVLDAALRWAGDSEEGRRYSSWAPSVVLKRELSERWNAHVEYFGVFSDGKERESVLHYISPGVHHLLTENCEIGVRLGCGLNDQSTRFFVNAGAGLRF